MACGHLSVPKVALAVFRATCSGATSEDLEGLSRKPCAHVHVHSVGGVLSEQRAFQGHGLGVQRKHPEDSRPRWHPLLLRWSQREGRGTLLALAAGFNVASRGAPCCAIESGCKVCGGSLLPSTSVSVGHWSSLKKKKKIGKENRTKTSALSSVYLRGCPRVLPSGRPTAARGLATPGVGPPASSLHL